jgi:Do/DeqQ family serine protease
LTANSNLFIFAVKIDFMKQLISKTFIIISIIGILKTGIAQHIAEKSSFVNAASISTPCVVHIKTKATIQQNYSNPFADFFGNDFFFRPPSAQKQEGSGSGVILSADGYIITNNHVIQDADEIEVILNNKSSYKAKLVGKDKDTDLALIKIEENQLPYINIANSENVMVGEWVLAVGNPFNLASTVTQGIVSAKGRSLNLPNQRNENNTSIESFIQTDAAVNPGNSGGALVNLNGELIGINTAIASPTGAYAGYAFAVPSNLVKKVYNDLKQYGTVQRAYLGVGISNLTSEKAKELGLKSPNGILLGTINKGGAAEQAGLQPLDVITKINEVDVHSSPELLEQISKYSPGDKILITYYRKGISNTVSTILKNKENKTEIIKVDQNVMSKIGIQVVALSAQEKARFRVNNGLKVVKINNGVIQQSTDLKEGFIILQIGNKLVNSEEDFKQILTDTEKGTVVIEGFYPNRPYTYQYAFKL